MCLTRGILDDKTIPVEIRHELQREWDTDGGHADTDYTEKRWKEFEARRKKYSYSLDKFLDAPKKYDYERLPSAEDLPEKSSALSFAPIKRLKERPIKSEEKLYKMPEKIWNDLHPNHKWDDVDRNHGNKENKSFKFPSNKLIIFLIIVAVVAYFVFLAPQQTRDNISASLEGMKNSVSSSLENAKNNVAQAASTNTIIPSQPKEETLCNSQLNEQLNILRAKLPSDSRVNIVNEKIFLPSDNINDWIKTWSSVSIDCGQLASFFSQLYICKDLKSVYSGTVGANETIAIGVAVKVEVPSIVTRVEPVLCDKNGNLLPNSKTYIIS